jgi:hypothetical protein
VIRLETGNRDDYKIIMGFRYIDDIVQEDMKKKQQMEETMADLKLNNEIISAISKMYRIIYRMDLIHDTYEIGCEMQRKRVECAIMMKAALAEE